MIQIALCVLNLTIVLLKLKLLTLFIFKIYFSLTAKISLSFLKEETHY